MYEKTALISGIRGMMASHLADLLIKEGYKVIGFERKSGSERDYSNIKHLFYYDNFVVETADLTDFASLIRILQKYQPDEIYNLAALSHVHQSFEQPIATCETNYNGVLNLLEAVRQTCPDSKIVHSSTSEVFGDVLTSSQNEDSPVRPRSPYGASKAGAEHLIKVYKESYNLNVCWTRNFNSESPRRGKQFVTRKITNWIGTSIAKCLEYLRSDNIQINSHGATLSIGLDKGIIEPLRLGNLDAKRDWTDCRDTVRGIHKVMTSPYNNNYVIGSGKTRSIREFLDLAFGVLDIKDWTPFIEIDKRFYRPAEVNVLCADPSKIKRELGWEPQIDFNDMVENMIYTDLGKSIKEFKNV